MKLFGEWVNGAVTKGKWIYPGGMNYDGGFKNNMPIGEGKWIFKNGNVVYGEYQQQEKVLAEGEEEPPAEEEENAIKKPKFNLVWNSHSNITDSAHKVNSVE